MNPLSLLQRLKDKAFQAFSGFQAPAQVSQPIPQPTARPAPVDWGKTIGDFLSSFNRPQVNAPLQQTSINPNQLNVNYQDALQASPYKPPEQLKTVDALFPKWTQDFGEYVNPVGYFNPKPENIDPMGPPRNNLLGDIGRMVVGGIGGPQIPSGLPTQAIASNVNLGQAGKVMLGPLSKQRAQIKEFLDAAVSTAESPQSIQNRVGGIVDAAINATRGKDYFQRLKIIRADLNRKMYEMAGASTGNYKKDYSVFQQSRKDPSIASIINNFESQMQKIDQALTTPRQPTLPPGQLGTNALPEIITQYFRRKGSQVPGFIADESGNITKVTTGGRKTQELFKNLEPNVLPSSGQVAGALPSGARLALPEGAPPKTQNLFQKGADIAGKWISTREGFTNWRAGDIKKNPALTQFDKEGIDAVIELQSGVNPQKYADIQKFNDDLFELEKEAGLLKSESYRQNYLSQLWDNTPEEIEQVFQMRVGKTPGFTKSRVIDDYATGIEAGLIPRYNTISDILTARFKTSQKALADREFVDTLMKSGNAKIVGQAPKGWQQIDFKHDGKPIAVPPDVARIFNNYTATGSQLLQKAGQMVSEAKQSILSAGIPKTGWNFHTGVNIPIRRLAGGKNPFAGVVDSVIWNTNPNSAASYVQSVPKNVMDGLLKAGLTISRSAEDVGYGFKPKEGTSFLSKARSGFDKLFSEAAFDKVLPAHKVKIGWETYEKALKQGMSEDEAFKLAAQTSNNLFGGVNTQAMGRNKDFQNVLRTFLLAPDWLESNIRLGAKTGGLVNPKNWSKPEYAPYKKFAVNAASMYTSFAMLNKAMSGHFPWENGAGQEFNLATGSYDDRGRERMVPVFGTAFDFVRLPLQVGAAALQGDIKGMARPIRNRLSPPVAAGLSLAVTGEDYRGRPIDTPGKVVSQLAQAVGTPSQITNVVAGLTGEQTPEEVAAGLLEAPWRFRGGATTPEKKQTAEILKQGGATNEQINKALTNPSPESKGLFGGLFGGGAQKFSFDKVPTTKKEESAYNQMVDTAFEAGAQVPDNAIKQRYFDGKDYSSKDISDRKDILEAMNKVQKDQYLTDEQKTRIAQAAGISPEDWQYYQMASMDTPERLQGILSFAQTATGDRNQLMTSLLQNKKTVGGKAIISDDMVNNLYDRGLLSKDEKAMMNAIKWDQLNEKFYVDRDYLAKYGEGGTAGQVSAAKRKAMVSKLNTIYKSPFKQTKAAQTQVRSVQAPTLRFTKSQGKKSKNQWFNSY